MEKEFYLKTKNGKIHCVINELNNNGKIMVLSHGFASNKDQKRFILLRKFLEKERINYFFFDYLNHGKSENKEFNLDYFINTLKEVLLFLKEKGYQGFIILAESIGALFSFLVFREFKSEIKSFILIGPFLKPKLLNIFYKNQKLFVELLEKGKIIIGKRKYVITRQFIKQIFEIDYNSIYKDVNESKIKILIVYGEKDNSIPKDFIESLQKELKNSEIIIIKEGDHVLSNKEELFVSIVLGWLKIFGF
jgi:pimeloyl-ACP methyl ester carboxylesterase